MTERNQKHEQFFKLFMANQSKIYTFILMLVPNSVDADDILQETASLMWSKFSDYRPDSDFASWGVTIARYKILDYRRKHFNSPIRYSNNTLKDLSEYAASKVEEPDKKISSLRHCLSKLSEGDRRLLDMRYGEPMTIKAVAERIGRSVDGLYKAMARIHHSLFKCIQRKESVENME